MHKEAYILDKDLADIWFTCLRRTGYGAVLRTNFGSNFKHPMLGWCVHDPKNAISLDHLKFYARLCLPVEDARDIVINCIMHNMSKKGMIKQDLLMDDLLAQVLAAAYANEGNSKQGMIIMNSIMNLANDLGLVDSADLNIIILSLLAQPVMLKIPTNYLMGALPIIKTYIKNIDRGNRVECSFRGHRNQSKKGYGRTLEKYAHGLNTSWPRIAYNMQEFKVQYAITNEQRHALTIFAIIFFLDKMRSVHVIAPQKIICGIFNEKKNINLINYDIDHVQMHPIEHLSFLGLHIIYQSNSAVIFIDGGEEGYNMLRELDIFCIEFSKYTAISSMLRGKGGTMIAINRYGDSIMDSLLFVPKRVIRNYRKRIREEAMNKSLMGW